MASQQPKKPRVSSNAVTLESLIALYSNSPEAKIINPNYTTIIPASVVAAAFGSQLSSDSLGDGSEFEQEEIDASLVEDDDSVGVTSSNEDEIQLLNTPSLSDIQVVSNEIVYDAAGLPSAKIIFKIKNSSGQKLKGVNVRVKSL